MVQKLRIRRTETPNSPPMILDPGELALEMSTPVRLWGGTPTGNKLLSPSGSVAVGDVPPSPAKQGDLWWESDAGILWLYYVDADSSQWVQAAGGGGGAGLGDFVMKTGDTMTGALMFNVPTGQTTGIAGRKGNVTRWSLYPGDAAPEVGANSGSNFKLVRHDDLGDPNSVANLVVRRDTGNAHFSNGVFAAGALSTDFGIFGQNGSYYLAFAPMTFFSWNGATGDYDFWNNTVSKLILRASDNAMIIAGEAYKPAGGPWLATSDRRVKNIAGSYTHGLNEIMQINPVRYSYKGNDALRSDPNLPRADGKSDPAPPQTAPASQHASVVGKEYVGLIAQDVEYVMPEMVSETLGWIDGLPVNDLRTLDTNALIFAMVNAIKQLKIELDTLKASHGV